MHKAPLVLKVLPVLMDKTDKMVLMVRKAHKVPLALLVQTA